MTSLLIRLRQHAPRVTARQFLQAHPGSHIQYFDDTPAKDPAKAYSARTFDPALARRKQQERASVTFSLQPFGERRTTDQLLCVRTLGVDVDLVTPRERTMLSPAVIDQRKDRYLRFVLAPFPLPPQYIVETRHGFHVLFRVQPQREPKCIAESLAVNRRLVHALQGDPNAVLLTQLMRVPGTLQFKIPDQPFLCRLLLDTAATIPPYPLAAVREALGAVSHEPADTSSAGPRGGGPRWRRGLAGAAEGQRNVTAASLAGKIIGRLPEDLWEIGAWGGLREWNRFNRVPLLDRELRAVFESIARREAARRAGSSRRFSPDVPPSPAPHAQQ